MRKASSAAMERDVQYENTREKYGILCENEGIENLIKKGILEQMCMSSII